MTLNYSRGYMLEWKTKKMLEKKGWVSVRSPASRQEADLIAFKGNEKLMIQCKKTSKDSLYIYGLKPLMDLANKHEAKPLLVYGFRRTPSYVLEITGDKHKMKRHEDNLLFEDYLREE